MTMSTHLRTKEMLMCEDRSLCADSFSLPSHSGRIIADVQKSSAHLILGEQSPRRIDSQLAPEDRHTTCTFHPSADSTRGVFDRQKKLWEDLFHNFSEWRDNRQYKRGPQHPDFIHKLTKEPLWLNNRCKPRWVDRWLATFDENLPKHQQESLPVESSTYVSMLSNDAHLERQVDALLRLDNPGTTLSVAMYRSLLKECATRKTLTQTRRVHAHLAKHGLVANSCLGEYVVSTLVKCDGFPEALEVFHRLPYRSVMSWSAVISGYVMSGQCQLALRMYRRMQVEGVQPNTYTFVNVLKACGSLGDLQQATSIRGEVVRCGFELDPYVGTCLVDMYAKCGGVVDAQIVFDSLVHRNVVSWTAMLSAYVQEHQAGKALQMYERMLEEGVSPDERTVMCMLQVCGMLADEIDTSNTGESMKEKYLEQGKALHAEAWRKGYDSEGFVASTLVSMYGRCDSFLDARNVFNGLSSCNVVPWNAMLAVSARGDEPGEALQLYQQMLEQGVSPDSRTFVTVLQACGMLVRKEGGMGSLNPALKSVTAGKLLHVEAWRRGFDSDIYVGNTLVSMYMKCGNVVDAQNVFDGLLERDVVSWNVLLTAYVEQGQPEEVLLLYSQMLEEGMTPDKITFACVLHACGSLGNLDIIKQMHHVLVCCRGNPCRLLATTLLHAYAKCSSMVEAQALFHGLQRPDVVSWNAMMAGYARQGNCTATLQCYQELQSAGCKPDGVTFLALLSACAHGGLVETGVESFESMTRDYGVTPQIEHYVSLVDLLARAGCFTRVEELLSTMPMQPNLSLWLCLLGACRTHGEIALGRQAFDGAVHLDPRHPAAYVLMWGIYGDAGLWDLARDIDEKLKDLRLSAGTWTKPGKSRREGYAKASVSARGLDSPPTPATLVD